MQVVDVTHLYPITVSRVETPNSVEELQRFLESYTGPISIGGGRYSMGGQTAYAGAVQIDMRRLNGIIDYAPAEKTIAVQAGVRWRDIQQLIDGDNLSIKIMQTYANFTVGGSLSVNVHGRYVGLGPIVLSVREIAIMLVDGSIRTVSPASDPELFYSVIGGYGGVAIILQATLELADNSAMERVDHKMPVADYPAYFASEIRDNSDVIFHNADLYPPFYRRCRAISWKKTDRAVTNPHRLKPWKNRYRLERYFIWMITEMPLGKWRREFFIDPLLFRKQPVVWRNYEASYDVAELEPISRKRTTFVLQEYFVPVEHFLDFTEKMTEILRRHRVNAVNISVRHAHPDPGVLLAWAKTEVFAFVLYYKQRTHDQARSQVERWTIELVDAALTFGGSYYLPYQPHASVAQFRAAYPNAEAYFDMKRKYDPDNRLKNTLWGKYYAG